MSELPGGGHGQAAPRHPHPALVALAALLFLEAVALAGLTAFLVFELFATRTDSFVGGLAVVVLTAGAAAWLFAMAVGALRGAPWIRGAAVTFHVLQIAVAVGAFQGAFARPEVGWLLLLPAIAVLALLFSRPVVAATRRDPA